MAKNVLAEFNLGCDAHRTEHVYRVYVSTFLGFGGNAARQRYEESIVMNTLTKNKYKLSTLANYDTGKECTSLTLFSAAVACFYGELI